jgi:outer membrane protein assembly factor BamB
MREAFVLSLVLEAFGCFVVVADWPQWRGPNRDGIWPETGVIEKFDSAQLPLKWRVKISNGYNGPTVAEGRVYVMDRITAPAEAERVHCFDAMTGQKIWSHSYECRYRSVGYPDGPRAAVSISDGRAYSLGTMGHLFCFDAAKGDVLWSKDLAGEYKARIPEWGIAGAPLVEGGLVIVQIGGADGACLAAFDKVSGQGKWRALNDPASYSAPIVVDQAGKRVVICLTGQRVVGLDASSGKLYWESPFTPTRMVIGIATPVVRNNYLFASIFYDGSLVLKLRTDAPAVEEVWRRRGQNERNTESLHCCISTGVILGDHIYGVDSYGELRCLDLYTGQRVWESLDAVPKARWANIHIVQQEDRFWMFNERGELIIAKLSPQGFHEVSRAKLIEPTLGQLDQRSGVCWSHPAFANRHVYVRNDQELVCADLSAKP